MMKHIIFWFAVLLITACNSVTSKPQLSVKEFTCWVDSSMNITPQMVEKNPMKFQGRCFTWVGKVDGIKESEEGRIWVYENIENSDYTYYGTCALSLSFNNDGVYTGKKYGYSGASFFLDKFVFDGNTEDIYEDDIVEITATVIGEEVKDHPLFEDKFIRSLVFAVHEIEKK